MIIARFIIFFFAGYFSRPIQQRNIHKTINNQSICWRIIYIPPRLNKLTLFSVSGKQMICRLDSCFFCSVIAQKLICSDAWRHIQKTHIMMINSQLFIYSFIKCRDMLHSKISVLFIIGKFIGNPKNSCPNSLNDVSGKQITVTAFYEETSLSVFNSKNLPCFFISSSYVPDSTHSPSSITTILFASCLLYTSDAADD